MRRVEVLDLRGCERISRPALKTANCGELNTKEVFSTGIWLVVSPLTSVDVKEPNCVEFSAAIAVVVTAASCVELSDASSVVVQPLTTVDERDPICAAVKNEMDMFYIPFVAAHSNPSVGRLCERTRVQHLKAFPAVQTTGAVTSDSLRVAVSCVHTNARCRYG